MKLVKPAKFNATFINKVFFPYEYTNKQLPQINRGRCYDWAYIAYCLWNNVILWQSDEHAWVQVESKFFDSESYLGRSTYKQLRCNVKTRQFIEFTKQVEVSEFMDYWNRFGSGRTYHWYELVNKIKHYGLDIVRT